MSGEKIKIALCLSGEPRSSMFCYPYIYESFINIGPEYKVDVYIHSRKNFRAFPLYNSKNWLIDNHLSPSVIELYNSLTPPPELSNELNLLTNYTLNINNIINQLLMIDGINKCFYLTKNNPDPYDIYIRCRPDLFTKSKIDIRPIISGILAEEYNMFIPLKDFSFNNSVDFNNSQKEYNDQFAIGDYKSMEVYANIINNLDYLLNTTLSFKAEKWLAEHLKQSNIKVNQFLLPFNLIRNVRINSNNGDQEYLDLGFLDQ